MNARGLLVSAAVLLEVLVRAAIFDELGGPGQDIRVGIKRDRLDNIGGEEVHEWLDFVHL